MPPAPDPWTSFRRLVGLSAIVALVTIAGALFYLHSKGVPFRVHVVLAMSLGIGLSIMLAGALMGLLFVSARSGHDEMVADDRDEYHRNGADEDSEQK